ncbi:hypothetical protein ILUMI_00411 [Ignelater luminosus]|uniref:Uncharacterized protein n=1 Tax=Ignelater luminosus TaxID=2038154 RepID=A0A8K0DLN5_IGNLU|nr:hypothetical protein ILUMI_00411 [Ignelater luminosus]
MENPVFWILDMVPVYSTICRKVIGSIIYAATTTRPDLAAAMSYLSRYQDYEDNDIWICLKCVLRYIKGSLNSS